MEDLFNTLLLIHIVGGSVGLLTGSFNLFRKKGDKKHRTIGKIFVCSMLMAGISSLILAVWHPNYFLFIVGIFTLYMIATGNRYIYLKLLGKNQKPTAGDWAITLLMLLCGVLFIVLGINLIFRPDMFGIVLIVFGGLGLLFVKIDFDNYKGRSKIKNYWLLA